MTITEAITSFPALDDVNPKQIEIAISRRYSYIDGSYEFSASVTKEVDIIAADLMMLVINNPEFTEGDLTIKYGTEEQIKALKATAKRIYDKYGDDAADTVYKTFQPGISNKSNLW